MTFDLRRNVTNALLSAVALTALAAPPITAEAQATKKKAAAASAPAAAKPTPAPVVAAPVPPPQKTPAQLRDEGMAFADAKYNTMLPPLPAEAAVPVDRAPQHNGLGINLGIGNKHNPSEGLISAAAKNLDNLAKQAEALKAKSAFDKNGDPFKNGLDMEAMRINAIQSQNILNEFLQKAPLAQFLNASGNEEAASKVQMAPRDANYSVAMQKSPEAADHIMDDTIAQMQGIAQGLRVSIGEAGVAKKHTFLGTLQASVTNGSRTQNGWDTAAVAALANHMLNQLTQHQTAFTSLINGPTTVPTDPYAAPAAPADPYAAPAPKPTTPPGAALREVPRPGEVKLDTPAVS